MPVPIPLSVSSHFSNARRIAGRSSSSESRRGFALLITVTLLAFLVLLLVALATLTRVETQVATNNQTMAQARQNALMALNIAVGQLQKYAGPDAQVTGRAELTSTSAITNPNFTGIWNAGTATQSPDMWLVSGSEKAGATAAALLSSAPNPSDDTVTNDTVFVVGNYSVAINATSPTATEKKNRIKLTKQDITAPAGSVPGLTTAATVGRYAWWIGDEGVKASLALPDRADEVTYAPWDTQTQRSRIRQQIGSGPNYFRMGTATTSLTQAPTKEGFDPFNTINMDLIKNIITPKQLNLLTPTVAGTQASFEKGHFYDFTEAAYSVLANTLPAGDPNCGLLHDLSLKPEELGVAFKAYVNYDGAYDPSARYMETPGSPPFPDTVAAVPAITSVDSPRRRYKMVLPVDNAAPGLPDITFSVAPVLTNFYIQFALSKPSAGSTTLNFQSRLYVTLWNPYSAALAPTTINGLSIDVELPTILADGMPIDLNKTPASKASGGVNLPFGANARHNDSRIVHNYGAASELASWLPGRIYSWATNVPTVPNAATDMGFYSNLLSSSWTLSPALTVPSSFSRWPALEIPAATVKVRLKLNGTVLSTYVAQYDSQTDGVGTQSWRFGYTFRLNQARGNSDIRNWLKNYDPRSSTTFSNAADSSPVVDTLSSVLIPFGTDSASSSAALLYSDSSPKTTSNKSTNINILANPLLFRIQATTDVGMSTYNDSSLFELPRLPLLSLGELQQLQLKDKRPYSIGNSWGGVAANVVFDRFFFSGLPAAGTHPALEGSQSEPLPNWNLKPLNGINLSTLRSDMDAANKALSSRYLLQAGGFNINSTSVSAWRAVLSSVRFNSTAPFSTVAIDNTMNNSHANAGTELDMNDVTRQAQTFDSDPSLGTASAPVFFRFPQSAQEVFYCVPFPLTVTGNDRRFSAAAFRLGVRGYNNPNPGGGNGFTGDPATYSSSLPPAVRGPYEQSLTTDQIELLAATIVDKVRARASVKGPFRSMQEFLSETDSEGNSVLEAAIKDAGMNSTEISVAADWTVPNNAYPGFSTLTLTQADLLNALAPYFRNRSDTFVIRTYGEVCNPATGTVDAFAWAEATVQRFPETVDSGDSIAQPVKAFGRRFKIIQFRWLTSTDI